MILSKIDLDAFIEKSKNSNLEVIDGKLIAHKKYKIDVLTYILNKCSEVREIRFFWEGCEKNDTLKNGVILGINVSMPFTIGTVKLKNNKIVISIDGFTFEDDSFNEYILKCYTDEKIEGYVNNDLFGYIRVKSNTGGNLVVLNVNRGGKSLRFNTLNYTETKDNITRFKIRNCYKSDRLFETQEIESLRMNYFNKIREIENRAKIFIEKFELSIDLKTGRFHFYSKFHLEKEKHRKFLEHIDYYYRSLNHPLYYSIIGAAEELLSENYQTTVRLSSEEMVRKYLDLDDMIAI
jgi:hypothetical protein